MTGGEDGLNLQDPARADTPPSSSSTRKSSACASTGKLLNYYLVFFVSCDPVLADAKDRQLALRARR
jgi:hypothetical protein